MGTGPSEVSTNLYESHEFCSYSLKFMFIRGQYVVGGLNRQGAQGASRKEHGVSADGQHSVEAADGTQQDVAYHTYSLLHSPYSFAARARAWGVVAWLRGGRRNIHSCLMVGAPSGGEDGAAEGRF